jgi:tetratricopeptide (TPR) repeat protein
MSGEERLARAAYATGDLQSCLDHALRGLERHPDDLELLVLAGQAGLELGAPTAIVHLRRVTDLRPDDAAAWRNLGLALLAVGEPEDAAASLDRAMQLDPEDEVAAVNLAHVAFAGGDRDRGVRLLRDVAERTSDAAAMRSLLEMQREAGDLRAALETAMGLVQLHPDDLLAAIDVAHAYLELEEYDDAVAAFRRLRRLDEEPGHQVFAFHGIVEAEAQAGNWRRALDQAIEATAVDRNQLTTDLLATAAAQLFGASDDREAPPWDELLVALATHRAEHRRMHQEPTGR